MRVTVAICTWNRADLLDQTLATLRGSRLPDGLDWELLIVNNNCADHTDEVIARHASSLPIRRIFEPAQGLSNARNAAVREARGDLLIWTDDDVLVDPDWLAEMVGAAEAHPDAPYFGGPIEPWFETDPPAWLLDNLDLMAGILVVLDHGREVRPLHDNEQAFGASLAFRMDILKGWRFNPDLGRKGSSLIGYDEIDLIDSLKRAGKQGVWVGTARLRHYIPARRMTKRFAWDWFVADGRSIVRVGYMKLAGRRLIGMPIHLIRRYVAQRFQCARLARNEDRDWLLSLREAAHTRGHLDEARHEWLSQRRSSAAGEIAPS